MTACAEQFLHQEPYDKLAEYYNIWLVYAHSRTAGTGTLSGDCTKFRTRHEAPGKMSLVTGDHSLVKNFVSAAIGKDCSTATVAVIMNSSVYGGTCYWDYLNLSSWRFSIAYTPACPSLS